MLSKYFSLVTSSDDGIIKLDYSSMKELILAMKTIQTSSCKVKFNLSHILNYIIH